MKKSWLFLLMFFALCAVGTVAILQDKGISVMVLLVLLAALIVGGPSGVSAIGNVFSKSNGDKRD